MLFFTAQLIPRQVIIGSKPRKETAVAERSLEQKSRSNVDRNPELTRRRDKDQASRIDDDAGKSTDVQPITFNRSAEMSRLSGGVWDDRQSPRAYNRKHTNRSQDPPTKLINPQFTANSGIKRRATPSVLRKKPPTERNEMDKQNIRKETLHREGGFIRDDQRRDDENAAVTRKRTAKHSYNSDEEATSKKNARSSLSPVRGVKPTEKRKQKRPKNSMHDREYQVNYCTGMVFNPQVNSSPKGREDEKENLYPGRFYNRSSKLISGQYFYNHHKENGNMNENDSEVDECHEHTEERLNYSRNSNNTDSGFSEDMSETQSRVDEEEVENIDYVLPKSTTYVNESQLSLDGSHFSSDEFHSDKNCNFDDFTEVPTSPASTDTSSSRNSAPKYERHVRRKNQRAKTEYTEVPTPSSAYSHQSADRAGANNKRHAGSRKSPATANREKKKESKSTHEQEKNPRNVHNTVVNRANWNAGASGQTGFNTYLGNLQVAQAQQNRNNVKDVKWTNAEKCAFLAMYRNENPYHAYDKVNRWKIFSAHMLHLGVSKSNEQCRGQVST